MTLSELKVSFKSIKIGKLSSSEIIQLPDEKTLEYISQNADVKLKGVNKNFPYRNGTISIRAIKITARPKGLTFFQKLFGKKTITDYYPTSLNLKQYIKFDFKGTFEEFLKKIIEKTK